MNNPIFAFSAIRRMRSARTPLLITLYSLLLALLAYFTVYGRFMGATVTLGDMRLSVDGYAYMIMLQFALLVLVAPAMTAGSISGERERQTLDLLLVTNTGAVKLVLGKLLESFSFLALMVMCSLPMLSLVLITGGATFAQVLVSVAFLLLTALAALSVGLVCSSLFQRTVTATVMSYLSVFALGIVTLLPLWHDVKRIGDLYDAMNIVGGQLHTIEYTPISFTINPALGLFSLLAAQTQMFSSMLWQFSYSLANTFTYLPFDHFLYCNMAFLAAASVLLIALAALNLRVRKPRAPKGKRA
ncbi:MAG TPA: ABC transporter permease [Candidatus Limiplasma pullistercoris]|nr:ABC transporter permease [Candidatus Limiplasma pullistercoris]